MASNRIFWSFVLNCYPSPNYDTVSEGGGEYNFVFHQLDFLELFRLMTSSGWQILPWTALAAATAGLER